jgi:outer membrane protein TolC
MSWNGRFRLVCQSLFLVFVLLYIAAADASSEERIPPLQETAAAQDQGSMNKSVEVQSAPTITMLTVSQCIDIALRTNPTILAALYSVDVNKEQVDVALSNYYPQVSAQATANRIRPYGDSDRYR